MQTSANSYSSAKREIIGVLHPGFLLKPVRLRIFTYPPWMVRSPLKLVSFGEHCGYVGQRSGWINGGQSCLYASEGVGKPGNFITLSPSVHQMHSQGHFAFEPIGRDSDWKNLVFWSWWLKTKQSSERVTLSELPQLSFMYSPREDRLGLHNACTDQPLCSSDVIALTSLVIPRGAWLLTGWG